MIYLALFLVTYALFLLSDRSRGILSWMFAACGIVLVCFVSGARDIGVGTDTVVYGYGTYLSAMSHGLVDHVEALSQSSAPLFSVYTWLASRLTGSFNGMLFFVQLGSLLPFCIVVRRVARGNTAICVLLYLLLFLPFSVNCLKQGIAVAFVFVAGCSAFQKKRASFIAALAAAVGFHLTAVVGALLYPLAALVRGADGSLPLKRSTFRFVVVAILLSYLVVIVFGEELVRLIAPIRDAYSYQLSAIGRGSISIGYLLLLIGFAAVGGTCLEDTRGTLDRERAYLYIISVVGLAAFQFDVVAESLSRFAYYGVIFTPLFFQRMARAQSRENYLLVVGLLTLTALVFIYSILIAGTHEVYPYTSAFLGIR